MLNKAKRKVLKRARKLIASCEKDFVCHALESVMSDYQFDPACAHIYEAAKELKEYVRRSLSPYFTLSCWQEGKGLEDRGAAQLRKDRLAWIDWMLAEPKPLHDETYCLAA